MSDPNNTFSAPPLGTPITTDERNDFGIPFNQRNQKTPVSGTLNPSWSGWFNALHASREAWTAYVPTVTGLTGVGTNFAYQRNGRTAFLRGLAVGTSDGSAFLDFTFPDAAPAVATGQAFATQLNLNGVITASWAKANSTLVFRVALFGGAVPVLGDTIAITVTGCYEAAS